MATLKESLTKGLTTINVKTNNFMEESKCKTYISTLEDEIGKLKLKIGEITYSKWKDGEEGKEEVEELLKEIDAKYQEISAQEEKIRKLAEEEQQILGTNAAAAGSAGTGGEIDLNTSEDVIYCSECGKQNKAVYKFCFKCGKPLQ